MNRKAEDLIGHANKELIPVEDAQRIHANELSVRKAEFDVQAAVAEIEGRISDAGILVEYSGDNGGTWINTNFIDTQPNRLPPDCFVVYFALILLVIHRAIFPNT